MTWPALAFRMHRVVRPLPRLLALEFVGERRQRQHDLVGRAVERPLAVLEVEEHPHAGLYELLQRVRGLDRFAAEPRFLGHDEHLERRPRLQRVHQPQESGPVRELGAADPVVDVDVLVIDGPALSSGVARAWSIWRATDFCSSATPFCSVTLRA